MTWMEMVELKEFTPLRTIVTKYSPIYDNILKVEKTKYIQVSTYNPLMEIESGELFVNAIIWACSDGAVLRMTRQQIEEDDMSLILPPEELLPSRSAITYGLIYAELKQMNIAPMESAGYRIADGKFVHRVIMSNIANYYFRGRKDNDNENPYAIQWNMKELDNK